MRRCSNAALVHLFQGSPRGSSAALCPAVISPTSSSVKSEANPSYAPIVTQAFHGVAVVASTVAFGWFADLAQLELSQLDSSDMEFVEGCVEALSPVDALREQVVLVAGSESLFDLGDEGFHSGDHGLAVLVECSTLSAVVVGRLGLEEDAQTNDSGCSLGQQRGGGPSGEAFDAHVLGVVAQIEVADAGAQRISVASSQSGLRETTVQSFEAERGLGGSLAHEGGDDHV